MEIRNATKIFLHNLKVRKRHLEISKFDILRQMNDWREEMNLDAFRLSLLHDKSIWILTFAWVISELSLGFEN